MTFTVSVSPAHGSDITLNYRTVDGTAISHADVDDYTATSRTVTIAPNTTSATFDVSTTEDEDVEIDDEFTVVLSTTQTDVMFGDDTAIGTIVNDDNGATGEPWWNCYEREEGAKVCLKQRIVMGVIDTHVDNANKDLKDKDRGYYPSSVVIEDDDEPHEFAVYLRRQPHTTFTVELTLSHPQLAPHVLITPRYLVFTPGNYSIAQKVSLQLLPNSITGSEKADVVARLVEFPDALVYGLYKQQQLWFYENGP